MFTGTPTAAVVLQDRSERNVVVSMLESAGLTVLVYEDISRALIGSAMPDFDIAVVSSNYILDYSGQEKACFGAKKMVVMVDVTQFDLLAHWSAKVPYTLLVRPLYRSELLSAVVELLDWETFEG